MSPEPNHSETHYVERAEFSRFAETITSLVHGIGDKLDRQWTNTQRKFDEQAAEIHSLGKTQASSGKIGGATIFGIVTGIIGSSATVFAGLVMFVNMSNKPLEDAIAAIPAHIAAKVDPLKERIHDHQDGHPHNVRTLVESNQGQINELRAELLNLDVRLQREMRDRDDITYWRQRAEAFERELQKLQEHGHAYKPTASTDQ